jgi:glycosyltransferase involved in cell wall biosynthesis
LRCVECVCDSLSPREHPMQPRVSIIIPNFDNGRESSRSGRDLLGELFLSLERTLANETVPFELLVGDDGSTDGSLATCRSWAKKRWPDGRPFLRLFEWPHSGVLSRVLNALASRCSGDLVARLDGDILLRTERWLTPLVEMFDRDPRLGVVTGVQLLPDGSVHAFGDDLWGPRGYRHIAKGAQLAELPVEREVDHAMGCFTVTRRTMHDAIGGYDEAMLRGQTEEYGVRVRLGGWRVMATSRVVFEHWHVDRLPRANVADRPGSLDESLAHFRAKWHFDRLAPDLEAVRERYGGTPLWWRDHAQLGADADIDEWERIGSDARLAARLREELELVGRAIAAADGRCVVTQVGCGCGVLGVTLARQGVEFEGFDVASPALDVAKRTAAALPGSQPRLGEVASLTRIPVEERSRPIVALLGALERSWNPVGVLREARRMVSENGVVVLRAELRRSPLDDPNQPGQGWTADEIQALIRHVGGLRFFGPPPRVLQGPSSNQGGWFECFLRAVPVEVGRGYFSTEVTPRPRSQADSAGRLPI